MGGFLCATLYLFYFIRQILRFDKFCCYIFTKCWFYNVINKIGVLIMFFWVCLVLNFFFTCREKKKSTVSHNIDIIQSDYNEMCYIETLKTLFNPIEYISGLVILQFGYIEKILYPSEFH